MTRLRTMPPPPTPSSDSSSFEEERWAHVRRSLGATLASFAAVVALFALFFGLAAVGGRL